MVKPWFAEGCNEDSREFIVLHRIVISEDVGCYGRTVTHACLVAIATELVLRLGRYSDRACVWARLL